MVQKYINNQGDSVMSKGKVVLLGLGMQGKAALHDLMENSDISHVVVVDNHPELKTYLSRFPADRVSSISVDVSDNSQLVPLLKGADVVLESLPGVFALPIGKLAAELGVNLVSSMYYANPGEEDPEKIDEIQKELDQLHETAVKNKATILTEFGMDPGIDLVLGAQALREMDSVDTFYSYGAGFPESSAADNPLKYKFTWSHVGVMRSYLRPGKIITGGKVKKIPGKQMFFEENIHTIEIEELGGKLECIPNGNSEHYAQLFNLMGNVKEMARYTCRWPGHCAFWRIMANCGFLGESLISVKGCKVSPVEFTAAVLESQKQFQLGEQQRDIAFIRIDVRGIRKGLKKRIVYQLIDKRDLATGFTAMQRSVGFTMSLGARLILEKKFCTPGLSSPIHVPYHLVEEGLKKHGMNIIREETEWLS